jgi:ATP-binding cassette subfamily A (ABC1) protein 3
LGILYPVASMIGYITNEKELRQKELMKMMSVTESDIGWSWFVSFFLFNILSILATTAMSTKLYENSEVSYLLSYWFFTFLSVTVFAMTVATFTSKASRGVLVGLLVFFIGVFMAIAIPLDYREDDGTLIGLISLHPVAAFSYGLQEIGRLEDQGTGLQSNTVGLTDNPSGYTFNDTIRYLIYDCIFWGIITFYLNRVIKPDYGQALPLWFPFSPTFWCPSCASAPGNNETIMNEENEHDIPLEPAGKALERQTNEGKSIEVRGLCKVFGEKVAVDRLNLSMYSGQITALLGHNGKCKSVRMVSNAVLGLAQLMTLLLYCAPFGLLLRGWQSKFVALLDV